MAVISFKAVEEIPTFWPIVKKINKKMKNKNNNTQHPRKLRQ